MTLHIGHPEPPCYPRGVNMIGISDASIIDRLQMSQNQLRSPMEHCWGVLEPILDLIGPERGLRLRKASKEELATLI